MANPIEIGKAFLDEVLALVPEAAREQARSAYSRAHDTFSAATQEQLDAIEAQRQQALALQQQNEQWRDQLRTWRSGAEAEIARREAALRTTTPVVNPANSATPPAAPVTPATPAGVAPEVLDQRFNAFGQQVLAVSADLFQAQQEHMRLFGDARPFNPQELYAHPRIGEVGVLGAFKDLHKDAIAQKQAEAAAAAEAKIRADERAKTITEFSSQRMPFPGPGAEDDSPLAILAQRTADQRGDFGAAAAVAELNRMRSIPA